MTDDKEKPQRKKFTPPSDTSIEEEAPTPTLHIADFAQPSLVVTYTIKGGDFTLQFYFRPNWWMRANLWLSGFWASWE